MDTEQNIWYRLSLIGVNAQTKGFLSSSATIRSNQLSVLFIPFTLIYCLINLINGQISIGVGYGLVLVLISLTLVLRAVQYDRLSRWLLGFLLLPVFVLPVLTATLVEQSAFEPLLYSLFALFFIPFMVYDRRREMVIMITNLAVNVLFLLFLPEVFGLSDLHLFEPSSDPTKVLLIPPQLNFYAVIIGLYALLGNRQELFLEMDADVTEHTPIDRKQITAEQNESQLEYLAKVLSVARVEVWIYDKDNLTVVKSKTYNDLLPSHLTVIELKQFSAYEQLIQAGKPVIVYDTLNDFRTHSLYNEPAKTEDLLSSIEFPIIKEGTVRGIVRCEAFAHEVNWEGVNLEELSGILNAIDPTYYSLSDVQQITHQLKEQQNLILSQNKELKTQRNELTRMLETQRKTQHELAKKEAEATSLLKSISEHNFVFEYDRNGNIIWLNEKSLDYLGVTLEQARGMNFSDFDLSFIREDDLYSKVGKAFWKSLLRGNGVKRETRLKVKGRNVWVTATFLPIVSEDGQVNRILGIAQDITAIRKQQEKIKEKNALLVEKQGEIIRMNNELEERVQKRTLELELKNTQLVEYTYINAHMLRAPVCNILGLVDLLDQSDISKEDREVVTYLQKASYELDDIVKKINETLSVGVDQQLWKNNRPNDQIRK